MEAREQEQHVQTQRRCSSSVKEELSFTCQSIGDPLSSFGNQREMEMEAAVGSVGLVGCCC